jgi:ferritin-like metal-binding protein YciE
MQSAHDLFLYEIGVMGQAERSGSVLLSLLIAKRVKDLQLERILHNLEDDAHRHVENIDACLRGIHASNIHTPTATVDGIRDDFEQFTRTEPAPEILDLYALDTAKRFTHIAIATYQNLADSARTLQHQLIRSIVAQQILTT